ncbi:hypothetical protein [Paraburkholderia sacchari]|uniref:hypothetical protein n=1 Tax=Paraburkholderia sacchari TaxID=159450 RepID=UPI0039A43A9B
MTLIDPCNREFYRLNMSLIRLGEITVNAKRPGFARLVGHDGGRCTPAAFSRRDNGPDQQPAIFGNLFGLHMTLNGKAFR